MKKEISPLTLKKHKKVIKKYYRKKSYISTNQISYMKRPNSQKDKNYQTHSRSNKKLEQTYK